MRTAYRVETVRAAERALMERLPDGALMQRAAAGLAAVCLRMLRPGPVTGARVVLLVGTGDNGGDALWAGARLAARGVAVTTVLLDPDRAHAAGLAALRRRGGRIVDTAEALAEDGAPRVWGRPGNPPALIVDGLLGIGGRGGLRSPAAEVVRRAAGTGAPVLAVDLPSGVEADTGEVRGEAVEAAVTVTFGTHKPALLVAPARHRAGVVHAVDIGLGPELDRLGGEAGPDVVAPEHVDIAALLPSPGPESDKYRRGVVGVAAGSERYPGAAVLAVAAALRGGAGAVRYLGPPAGAVLARHPEVLVGHGRVQAWVVGPGLDDTDEGRERLAVVLADDVPTVVDADALALLRGALPGDRRAPLVLTPHAGEAARMLGAERDEVEARRLWAVRELAARFRATTLLKGSTTLVTVPPTEGPPPPVIANPTGTPWLATAGTGDVLAGLIGSLLAAGLAPGEAAMAGAYLHGLAARLCPEPPVASDVAAALPAARRLVTGSGATGSPT
ncbi:NAD(P)H-hydrate dehydratase [Streptomyces alkaliphilus]|uniref:Bifunctional NAD(P)H-hydrate repair enzyme n=1 Tax=Streptomyces alkaliphilus TaxID=1472722 RepID=A0A7W3Y0N0_9ACTN|nr:NAD(P)H-hydrate dehydratase [Streptomyces alkaliphilus]MBB0243834.1 NAD(P)H-hydrate dehydratase [Streptomyces alkaliphilus]